MKFTLKDLQTEFALILLGQASSTTVSPPTNSPVEPGEKVIGVLEDPMVRMLYSLCERIRIYLEDYTGTVSRDDKPEVLDKHLAHVKQVASIMKMVSKLMWMNIGEQFPESAHPKVGSSIRDGWQVVVWKEEDSDDEFPFGKVMGVLEVILKRSQSATPKEPAPGSTPAASESTAAPGSS